MSWENLQEIFNINSECSSLSIAFSADVIRVYPLGIVLIGCKPKGLRLLLGIGRSLTDSYRVVEMESLKRY